MEIGTEGRAASRVRTGGKDELAAVATSVNSMLDALQDSRAREREGERQFQELLASTDLAAVILDLDGHVTFCNDYLLRLTGRSRDEVLGQDWFAMFIPPELDVGGMFKAGVERGVIVPHFENEILTASGGRRLISWTNTTLRDLEGRAAGTASIGEDITERKGAEQALRQSEARLRALFASMHDVVLVIDDHGFYREIAPTNPGLLVKPSQELLGRNLLDVFPPEEAATFLSTVQQVLDTKQSAQIEYDLIIGDRTVRFETSVSPMTEDSTLWVAHDISQRQRSELVQNTTFRIAQAAITSEGVDGLYRSIHSILGELMPAENFYIALYDPVSESTSFPYFRDQHDGEPPGPTKLEGLTGYVIRAGSPLRVTREVFDRLVREGEVEAVGTPPEDWMGAPLKTERGTIGVVALQSYAESTHFSQEDLNLLEFVSTQVAQVIERKRMEEEIRSLSLTDELTGLHNRRGFALLAEQAARAASRTKRSMSLFFFDVDKLKAINDAHGHAQGDLALQEVSGILKDTFREADIQARFGGDEFVVLAVEASTEGADFVTSRIRAELEQRNQKGGRPYPLSLSMGVVTFDHAAPLAVSEMIAQADALMYQEKEKKKSKN